MRDYQRQFLELALRRGVLRFGQFTLKSGRISPYFFNAGLFASGSALAALGRAYAQSLIESGIKFDMLFGPAYKGIALACATAIALAQDYELDIPVAYNRKESKDHGEGGALIGSALQGRVVIIDDVISAGTSVRESVQIIRSQAATPAAVLIAIDRQERGLGAISAADEIRQIYQIPVLAIANLENLIDLSQSSVELLQFRADLEAYRAKYGTSFVGAGS